MIKVFEELKTIGGIMLPAIAFVDNTNCRNCDTAGK